MNIEQISHLCLLTKDLNLVKKFYLEIMGFSVSHTFTNDENEVYGLFIEIGGGTFLEFFKNEDFHKNTNSSFQHLCFSVKNLDEIYHKLSKFDKNIKIKFGKTDNIKQFFTKDLEGNIIEFHEKKI